MPEETVQEIVRKYWPRWKLQVSSYQIRNPDGTAGGWVPQVHVWEERGGQTTIRPLTQKDIKIYDSQAEADEVAMRMGAGWLKNNAY